MNNFCQEVIEQATFMQAWELIGVVSALFFTILAAYEKKACWIFGLISSAIYVYLCIKIRLYQDAIINIYYVFMAIYGWWNWSVPTPGYQTLKPIQWLKVKERISYLSLATVFTIMSGSLFYFYTDASFPFADAFTTVFAFLATWLQARKKIENWILFFIVDAVSAVLYFKKSLYLTSLLFVLYTLLCVFAWYRWKQKIKYSA
ncbi:MAG: nicotinamide riboside transporter PnuC [Flavobacteriales bacterium]|nr:nicotinamide riboside transporter PnuC [Flavobacteriales bacterium]